MDTRPPLNEHAIAGSLLYEKLKLMESGRVLLLVNACYSGGVMPKLGEDDTGIHMPLSPTQIKKLLQGKGFAYLSASLPSQKAETGYLPSGSLKRYSPFTLGLARGFAGESKANDDDGLVYFSDLTTACVAYVNTKTKKRQLPHFDFKGDNFAVGYYRRGAAKRFLLLGDNLKFDVEVDAVQAVKEDNSEQRSGSQVVNVGGTFNKNKTVYSGFNIRGDFKA